MSGKIELVQFDLAGDHATSGLSPEEVFRAGEMGNPLLRSRYERTRSFVRRVLAARLNIRPDRICFMNGARGKPRIADPISPTEFSISHSGDILMMAVGDFPVGVDVEARGSRQNIDAIARRFFSNADFAIINEVEGRRDDEFLRQWVAKEAALKAIGSGLGDELRVSECEYHDGGIVAVRCTAGRIPVAPFELSDGTSGAVAWLGVDGVAIRWRDSAEFTA